MRIVVTGACGLIGSDLIATALARGDTIIAIDNLMYGGHPPLLDLAGHPRLRFIRADVRNDLSLVLREAEPDAIVHLAAIVGAPACHRDPELAAAVNVNGTGNVVRTAARVCPDAHLVFASTDSTYGKAPKGKPVTETTPLAPLSEYGRDKDAGERIVRGGCRRWTIARFATAFGLSRRLRLDLMVNDFTWQAIQHHHLIVYEAGFGRTFLHVKDLVRAILLVLDRPEDTVAQTFNVGDDALNVTKADIAKLVAEIVPGTTLNLFGEGVDPDQRNYVVDHTRVLSLGFEATMSLRVGIEELVRGYAMIDARTPWRNN